MLEMRPRQSRTHLNPRDSCQVLTRPDNCHDTTENPFLPRQLLQASRAVADLHSLIGCELTSFFP